MAEPLEHLPLRRIPAQSRSRAKVARALAAADRLLDEKGPEALNLTRVAQEAGLSAGALHQYLPDRDAILRVLAARYYERLEALMAALMQVPDSAADIGGLLEAVVGIYRDEAALRSLRLGTDTEMSQAHKARMATILTHVLLARGLVTRADAEARARAIFFASDGVLKEAFRRDPQGDPDMLRALRDMIEATLAQG